MIAKKVRSRIVTSCLVTMLLPAGAVLAQNRMEPMLVPCLVKRDQEIGLRPAAATDHRLPILGGELFLAEGLGGVLKFWDPLSVSPDRVEASSDTSPVALAATSATPWLRMTIVPVCPVEPTDGATELPGAVKNLRRADQR